MVQRILTEMFRFNLFTSPPTGNPFSTVTSAAHQAVGNDVAEKSATLLKNSSHTLPLSADHAGTVAVIGPAASTQPIYGGGGSAYVNPSQTVTPLAGLQAAAGSGTNIVYQPGLPTDTSLAAIPSSDLTPAYNGTGGFGAPDYNGTLTAPETGTYVLAITNSCFCYTPTNLSIDGTELLSDPSTPPVHTYSVAVTLTAGQHTLSVTGQGPSSALTWATPSDLAPGIAAAASAAKSATTAVVVVSDDTESEATDRLGLNLPSAQDELISAVAAANPQHSGRDRRGSADRDAVAQPGQLGARRVVSRPVERDRPRGRAVRQVRPERPPAGDVPDRASQRSRHRPRRSSPG